MKLGFVKLQREIQGTWIHKNPLYFKAYCDILFTVNWESKYVLIDNKRMLCNVGESLLCLNSWAKVFGKGWDKSKVRRFFKRLADSHIVETHNERKTTRLKLVGIDLSADERHSKRTETDTETERKATPTKEGRRKKEEGRKERSKDIVDVIDVCAYFQTETGKRLILKDTDAKIKAGNKFKLINARIKDGASVEDCKAVIRFKNKEWKQDAYMKKYIRIQTMFTKQKFDTYLDEVLNSSGSTAPKKFTYELPDFETPEERQYFFFAKYTKYAQSGILENRLVNTEYRQRALIEKDAEGLCHKLELENPELLKLN